MRKLFYSITSGCMALAALAAPSLGLAQAWPTKQAIK